LNYWSLGVEEQFYLVYPTLFLFVAWWARKRSFRTRFTVVLLFVIVASYTFSIVFTSSNPQGAYFSPFTRACELALGGLIAVQGPLLRRLPPHWAGLASWVGLVTIVLSAVTLNEASVYPGAVVALPILGAGLVIAAGASGPTWGAERMLALRPLQFVGAISFSLYLWHWPILQIAWQSRGVTTFSVWNNILLLLGAGVVATLTYYFFENPLRRSKFLGRRRWASIVMGLCLVAATIAVTTIEARRPTVNLENLATPGLAQLNTGQGCPPVQQHAVQQLMGSDRTAHSVVARVLLLGDSTACSMLPGLEAVGNPVGVKVENAAVIGCGIVSGEIAPQYVDGRNVNAHTATCQLSANRAELRALRAATPNVVLWASSWERMPLVVGAGANQKVVQPGSPQWYAVLQQRMTARARDFTATGATVYMLTQPPFVNVGRKTSGPTPQDQQFERLNTFLTDFAAHTPHVRVLDLAARVCPSGPPCPVTTDGVWVRGDGAHYTPEGSLWAARWVMARLGIPALENEADNSLPAMTMSQVSAKGVLSGTHALGTIASFNLGGIDRVQFKISGASLKKAILVPGVALSDPLPTAWVNWWNTREVSNGTYEVRSIVSNAAGHAYSSKGVTFKVVNSRQD
jgi:hypothetical protein